MSGIDSHTVSMLHFEGSDDSTTFTDEIGKTWTAAGSAKIKTSVYRLGGASAYFDGGSGISTPDSDDFEFGSGDFSIDMWVYPTAAGQVYDSVVIHKAGSATEATPFMFNIPVGTYNLKLMLSVGSNGDLYNGVIGTLTQNTWAHIAVCRNGSSCYAFINGVCLKIISVGTSSLLNNTGALRVGSGNYVNCYYTGYIDEVRIQKNYSLVSTPEIEIRTSQYSVNPDYKSFLLNPRINRFNTAGVSVGL